MQYFGIDGIIMRFIFQRGRNFNILTRVPLFLTLLKFLKIQYSGKTEYPSKTSHISMSLVLNSFRVVWLSIRALKIENGLSRIKLYEFSLEI